MERAKPELVRVFISYSHDSDQHRERVRDLANRLGGDDIKVRSDLDEPAPVQGWPQWSEAELDRASYVIVVCSAGYLERFNAGVGAPSGVGWESKLIRQDLYDEGGNTRFVPVMFDPADELFVPKPLRPYNRYLLPNQYAALLHHLKCTPPVLEPRPSPPAARPAPWRVPALPALYLPPKELEALEASLVSGQGHLGIHGMPGVGKTLLAAALASSPRVVEAFPGGVYWLTVGHSPEPAMAVQKRLALRLKGAPVEIDTPRDGKDLLIELFSRRPASLLVLDDVWSAEDAEPFNVVRPPGRLLVTTRNKAAALDLGATVQELSELKPEDALTLLAKHARRDLETLPEAAPEIVRECGQLPLALALVGLLLRDRKDDRWPALLSQLREAHHPELLSALEVSVQELPREIGDRYLDFAIFGEDVAVPEHVLHRLWGQAGVGLAGAQRTVDTLVDHSLVRRDAEERLSLHALAHDYVRAHAGDLRERHARLLAAYRSAAPDGALHMLEPDGYFFEHAPRHVLAAGGVPALRALLFDHRWLLSKLKATEVSALLADFERMNLVADQPLRLLRDAIRLSTHVLGSRPEELPGQLLGRLRDSAGADLRSFCDQVADAAERPFLAPLWASLTPPGGPLLRVFEEHADPMRVVAVSADGGTAISGGWSGVLKAWDVTTGKVLMALDGHQEGVQAVALSADGTTAVSVSWDRTLKVWDLAVSRPRFTLQGHSLSVDAVALSADGRTAITGSADTTMVVWDLAAGQRVHTLCGGRGCVMAVAITAGGKTAISGTDDGTLERWDLASGTSLGVLGAHQGPISAVALSADGMTAVSCSSEEGTLRIWDVANGRARHTVQSSELAVALSADGKTVISGSLDRVVKVRDTGTGLVYRTLHGHRALVHAVALSGNGRTVVSSSDDRTVRVWDLAAPDAAVPLRTHEDSVLALALRGDGKVAVSGSRDGWAKVWDVEAGYPRHTLTGHQAAVRSVALSAGGEIAVSGSDDATQVVWDVDTGGVLQTVVGDQLVALSADGKTAVSAHKTLRVWDVSTGQVLRAPETERQAPARAGTIGLPQREWCRGDKIGNYEVLTQLSIGSTAELFLCFAQGDGAFLKFVVIKRILPDLRNDESVIKTFYDEARITSVLRHPNIAQVLDLGGEAGDVHLVMEFIAGQDLNQISDACQKRKQLLPLGLSLSVCRDVCHALHFAHTIKDSAGRVSPIIHRDVAQKNVMVTYDGRVKLLDFGIAKARGSLGRTPALMVRGTTGYMSPEQVRGETLDGRSDVFGLGVVLFELLTGKRLFAAETETEEMERILAAPIPRPDALQPKIPSGLVEVVLQALARDRARRFASAQDLARALEDVGGEWMYDADKRAAFMRAMFAERIAATRSLLESAGARFPDSHVAGEQRPVSSSEDKTVTMTLRGLGEGGAGADDELVRALALSRDGKTALSAASNRKLTVWEVATRKALRTLAGHQGAVQAVALSGDGTRGLSGSDDATIKVWDLTSGQALRTLEGHGGPVLAVALSEDGKTAVSGSDDRTLKAWDVEQGRPIASFSGEAAFRSVAVDRELRILAGDDAGRLHRLALRVAPGATAAEPAPQEQSRGETILGRFRRLLGRSSS